MAYWPHPRTAEALPLSGVHERMLRKGGWYRPRHDLYAAKANGSPRPRKPGREFYPGEFTEAEPDPNVSHKRPTGTLVRRMILKGWNRDQILDALLDRHNCGGAWFRWWSNQEPWLDYCIAHTTLPEGFVPAPRNPPISPHPCTGNPPISDLENPPITPSMDGSLGPIYVPGIANRLVAYAQEAPRSRTDLVERGPIRHKGMATWYTDQLTAMGIFVWTDGPRTKPRGPVPKVAKVVRDDLADLITGWMQDRPNDKRPERRQETRS